MFRRGRSLIFGMLAAAIGGAVVCAPAQAGIVAQAQSVPVKRAGLSATERQAITIRSVTAASDPSLGLVVTVDFAGDVERYLGQAALKNALLALVLEPGTVTPTPNWVAEQGGGFTPASFSTPVRHGKRETVRRATVDVFSTEHVLRTFTGGQYGVIRDGDQVVFRIAGPALANVAGIKVKLFVKSPLRSTKAGPTLTSAGLASRGGQPARLGRVAEPQPEPAEQRAARVGGQRCLEPTVGRGTARAALRTEGPCPAEDRARRLRDGRRHWSAPVGACRSSAPEPWSRSSATPAPGSAGCATRSARSMV